MLPSYKQKETRIKKISDFFIMNIGLLIVALGSVLFKKPHHFASGGINGLAIVIQYYFPHASLGMLMLIINVILLILGYFLVSKTFVLKSIYGALALSIFTWILEVILPFSLPLTNQKFMELIYGVILAGIGSTLAFYKGASTGGTDIIAMIIRKLCNTRVSIGLLIIDMSIALSSGLVYGMETMLFSVFGVIIKVFVMDALLETIQVSKIFTITIDPENLENIKSFIVDELGRSASVSEAKGAYSEKGKLVVTTVLERGQCSYLQNFIDHSMPEAFVTITNSSSIIGRGFTSRL